MGVSPIRRCGLHPRGQGGRGVMQGRAAVGDAGQPCGATFMGASTRSYSLAMASTCANDFLVLIVARPCARGQTRPGTRNHACQRGTDGEAIATAH